MSLKVLNKDFKLKKIYDKDGNDIGKFDRENRGGDWVRVEGIDSLQNGIIISIMTIYGELRNNPLYGPEFGNKTWTLIKDLYNPMNKFRMEEYTKETLKRMIRIENIEDMIINSDVSDPFKIKTNILVKAITDDVIPVTIEETGGIKI